MATNTYVALQKTTLSSATASVTLSSIPSGYTDLVLVTSIICATSAAEPRIRFNSDTGTNYSFTYLSANGTTAISSRGTSTPYIGFNYYPDASTSAAATTTVHLQNYSNTTTNKTVIVRTSNANTGVEARVGLWRSTAAISEITLFLSGSGNMASGSTFSLYGIAADSNTAKATGGTITNDASYFYHTFTSSGTFTPTTSLSCDYLVVAGGGGGGNAFGAGGGAGGLRSTVGATGGGGSLESQINLSATAYSVTVGGGGTGAANDTTPGTNGSDSVISTITSTGGGKGGTNGVAGSNGGSGGAGSNQGSTSTAGGTGTANQGYAGGTGSGSANYGSGGGGGAGAVGNNGTTSVIGSGGAGVLLTSWAAGTSTGVSSYYAGGGGGGATSVFGITTAGAGGSGGGGSGANSANSWSGYSATANTGSGGGGGGFNGAWRSAGNGASGIVIVRYAR